MSIKVIFLDIDGVLQTRRSSRAFNDMGILSVLDPVGVKFLDTICGEDPSIKVVISSTWRLGRTRSDFSVIFGALGAINLKRALYWGAGDVVGDSNDFKTLNLKGIRGDEVEEWLARHPDVEEYVILDDDSDFHEYQKSRLVQTSYDVGISHDNMLQVENILFGGERLEGSITA